MKEIFKTWYEPLLKAKCINLLDAMLPQMDILYENTNVYPYKNNVFRVFMEPYDKIKVIILGQDPYHSSHIKTYLGTDNVAKFGEMTPDACGLSFITENGFFPPSLKRLYKELQDDKEAFEDGNRSSAVNRTLIQNYDFSNWPNQGIMMLNTALTVEAGLPGSHMTFWKEWSNRLVYYLTLHRKDVVWVLLGKYAQDMLKNYDCRKVEAAHPSPLARGFPGSRIYSRTNELLKNKIIW